MSKIDTSSLQATARLKLNESRRIYAEFVKRLRVKAGISAAELSLELGEREDFIERFENGHAKLGICEFLHIATQLGHDRLGIITELETFFESEMAKVESHDGDIYLASFIQRKRTEAKLSQTAVARLMGKTQAYIAKIEQNGRRLLLDDFIDFAKAIKVSPEDLLREILASRPSPLSGNL